MSNRGHYREHRVRTSLQGHLGRSSADSDAIERLASRAYHESGGVYFTEEQLQRMPWEARELILGEARRIYGRRRTNGQA